MNKTILYIVVAIAIVVVGFFMFNNYIYQQEQGDGLTTDYLDATYAISGVPLYLNEGGVDYFGNEVEADLDGDGDMDKAFIIRQVSEGSGTFYYLAGAINEGGKYHGTNAMFIGDRIAPQTTEFKDGQVIVNYADRAPTEPFTTPPSIGKSLHAKYSAATNDFGEVVQNFEGESAK
jgi:hypothetical protein